MDLRPSELLPDVIKIAKQAGLILLEHYNSAQPLEIINKSNNTPVTAADLAADAYIREALARLTPGMPIVTEETVELWADKPPPQTFWIVDPLDGTKMFIERIDSFQTQIALIVDRVSVLGVTHQPARGVTWSAAGPGTAQKEENGKTHGIRIVPAQRDKLRVVSTHFDFDAVRQRDEWIAKMRPLLHDTTPKACRFCGVADGTYDVFPFFLNHAEWDTAPGQAILEAAGGALVTLDGKPVRYGNPGFFNGPQFALGGITLAEIL